MSTHYSLFSCELHRISERFNVSKNGAEVLSRIVPSGENITSSQEIKFKSWKKKDLITLAIWHYSLPVEASVLIRLYLEERIHIPEIGIILKSREHCILFLQEHYSGRSLFGNYFNEHELLRISKLLFLHTEPKSKPKRKIRHRGYRDKGTLRRLEEHHSFWDSGAAQQEIEEERDAYLDTLDFLSGFLE